MRVRAVASEQIAIGRIGMWFGMCNSEYDETDEYHYRNKNRNRKKQNKTKPLRTRFSVAELIAFVYPLASIVGWIHLSPMTTGTSN